MWLDRTSDKDDCLLYDHFDANIKRVIFAFVLSIFPGLGHVYAGKSTRGIIALSGLLIISWLCAVLILWTESRVVGFFILCLPFVYALALGIDAVICAVRTPIQLNKKRQILSINIIAFMFIFICAVALMDYLIGNNYVRVFIANSESMHPNIMNMDFVLIDKISTPKRKDIALIDFNSNSNNEPISMIIKDQTLRRIIATQGDIVEIAGSQVYINNLPLKEKYTSYEQPASHNIYMQESFHWGPEQVPAKSYFVLADSRHYGLDSRSLGFIDERHIHGIASKVLWSWNIKSGHFKWDRTVLNIKESAYD